MKNKNIFFASLILTITFLYPVSYVFSLDLSELDQYLYPKESSKTISMDFQQAELAHVLKIFSQQSGLNFIASSDIEEKEITLYLENVPVEEALERILSANNFTYERKPGSNVFVVKKLIQPQVELMTRVYHLSHTNTPSSKIKNTLSNFDNIGDSGSEEDSSEDEEEGILQAITSVLTKNGSVIEDIRTNSIVVSDIPSQFHRIEQVIKRLDIRVPQILIEAEMLDVSKSTADLLGAKYSNTIFNFTGASKDSFLPFDSDSGPISYTAGAISYSNLQTTLQFLRTQTDTKNLARPRILTINNETAEIQISTDEAIGITTDVTSAEGQASSVTEAERAQTGVFLTVTPQANIQTGEITMAIEPRVIQAVTSSGFDRAEEFKDTEERGTKSILRVQDGDTIMIGGLLRNNATDIRTRIPVLGDIPLIGGAFRHKDKSETQRELIVFITPHILKDNLTSISRPEPNTPFLREQDMPSRRLREINQELSVLERHRY